MRVLLGSPCPVTVHYLVIIPRDVTGREDMGQLLPVTITFNPVQRAQPRADALRRLLGGTLPSTIPPGLTPSDFEYACADPSVERGVCGDSGMLLAALHHAGAVAAYFEPSLAGALHHLYGTGALRGDRVVGVDQVARKIAAIVDHVHPKITARLLIPTDNEGDLSGVDPTLIHAPEPAPSGGAAHSLRVKDGGVVQVHPVATLAAAERVTFGCDALRFIEGARRRARWRYLTSWLPALAALAGLLAALAVLRWGAPCWTPVHDALSAGYEPEPTARLCPVEPSGWRQAGVAAFVGLLAALGWRWRTRWEHAP